MFRINEAYEVLSREEKRADYDNVYMLNGGSKIELVRNRVRRAKEIILRDRSLITREEMKLIESIIDYFDRNTQETCFGWMTDILCERPEMARYVVFSAFDEQLLRASHLLDTLLEKASYAMTWEKIYLFWRRNPWDCQEGKQRNYNQLARILCHRIDLAKYVVYPAFQEQACGCESCLLPTLLKLAPQEITQANFNDYVETVNGMRWIFYGQLRSYNEQAIVWILNARPDLVRKPEENPPPRGAAIPITVMPLGFKCMYNIIIDLPAFFEFKERRMELTFVLWLDPSFRGPGITQEK